MIFGGLSGGLTPSYAVHATQCQRSEGKAALAGRHTPTARRSAPAPTAGESMFSRRNLLASSGVLIGTGLLSSSADAAETRRQETNVADSAYIQNLLARTEQFREQRYKERLAAYDKKNFKEYFQFEAGSLEGARARGISDETFYKIQAWLKANK